MDVISVRVPKELKRMMKEINVNWSEEIRRFIEEKIKEYRKLKALEEIDSMLSDLSVLYGKVSKDQANRMFRALEKLKEVVVFERFENYLKNAVKIAVDKKVTVYDSLYIAQAKKVGKLLTSDDRQGRIAEEFGIDVVFIE